MNKNKSTLNPLLNTFLSYLFVSFVCFVIYLTVISITALINLKNPVFDGKELSAELIAVIISSVICGAIPCKVKNKAIINGFVSGTFLSFFIIAFISALSKFSFNFKELIIIAICIIISTVCAIVKNNFICPKRRKK